MPYDSVRELDCLTLHTRLLQGACWRTGFWLRWRGGWGVHGTRVPPEPLLCAERQGSRRVWWVGPWGISLLRRAR
jgi:hypothetical protein